ncbi:MAG: 1,4-alpha-glucan branching protein GlgB [Sporomusaceae bacterium]|nr:1,4-alpha-glucan branching protein GlgB [Sporomusaceae bacterium]
MKASKPGDLDIHLFHEGNHVRCQNFFGAHIMAENGVAGVRFTVWAPHARSVSVIGDFNGWSSLAHPLVKISDQLWSLWIPEVSVGALYKYEITAPNGAVLTKADPFAFASEIRPLTASVVVDLSGFSWTDQAYQAQKKTGESRSKPMVIYEVHAGSWRRHDDGGFLTYRDLAKELIPYVQEMGYTHIELMPLTEHPLDASWGYQSTGYFSLTSRYGSPHDFMHFVNECHKAKLGVILDWVPAHFCRDDHGLRCFDGEPLFESGNAFLAENPQWGTANFDYGRMEVQSFLTSNALFWFETYHIDGLRIDAVASMLYLDYGNKTGWTPNKYGGRENLEAISLIQKINSTVYEHVADPLLMAEESTAWPLVTKPTYVGGLGFTYKWNMGWMNDILKYMEADSIFRKWLHHHLTFSFMYAFSENYVLPLSHDEVVHGKKSLLSKMPGDYWQKFANLRAFYGYMMAHPGKKLLFMGGEFGQFIEWDEGKSLDWHLLEYDMHSRLQTFVAKLNHCYREQRALWLFDDNWQGLEWIDHTDFNKSIIIFMRKTAKPSELIIVACNFTPVVRAAYRFGVPFDGLYEETLNSDWPEFGGSGQRNQPLQAEKVSWHGKPYSIVATLPPLATVYFTVKLTPEAKVSKGGCL